MSLYDRYGQHLTVWKWLSFITYSKKTTHSLAPRGLFSSLRMWKRTNNKFSWRLSGDVCVCRFIRSYRVQHSHTESPEALRSFGTSQHLHFSVAWSDNWGSGLERDGLLCLNRDFTGFDSHLHSLCVPCEPLEENSEPWVPHLCTMQIDRFSSHMFVLHWQSYTFLTWVR